MVATNARKARREAASAAAAAPDAAAAPSTANASAKKPPTAAVAAAAAPATNAIPALAGAKKASSHAAPILKGTGSKAGGGYTPPAILRAVANAARNKEQQSGTAAGAGEGEDGGGASGSKADWECVCGRSNFAKRLQCFKCAAPKPGRKFTAAGVKGYEKRQARRQQAQLEGGGKGKGEKRKAAEEAGGDKESARQTKQKSFGDAAGTAAAAAADGADGATAGTTEKLAPAAGDWAWAGKAGAATTATPVAAAAATAAAEKERPAAPKRKSIKSSDRGKPPKQLRDPTAPLVYLEQWMESRAQLQTAARSTADTAHTAGAAGASSAAGAAGAGSAKPPKPTNGWKLDKNIQNWLLYNIFDEAQVDEVVFAIMLLYIPGLRGGPLERLRESARESNFGKGAKAERTRSVLRELAGVGEGEEGEGGK
jgi:Rab3 GTPase-activating protein catalytic subunit